MQMSIRNRVVTLLLAFAGVIFAAFPCRAADEKGDFKIVAPFLDENTFLVARANSPRTCRGDRKVDQRCGRERSRQPRRRKIPCRRNGRRPAILRWLARLIYQSGRAAGLCRDEPGGQPQPRRSSLCRLPMGRTLGPSGNCSFPLAPTTQNGGIFTASPPDPDHHHLPRPAGKSAPWSWRLPWRHCPRLHGLQTR